VITSSLILPSLVGLPFVAAALTPLLPDGHQGSLKQAWGLGVMLLLLVMSVGLLGAGGLTWSVPWLPMMGVQFALGTDGISTTLVLLTAVVGTLALLASRHTIKTSLSLYYSLFFVLIGSLMGVFLARDLFLFFLMFELELIPMYLLIAKWGGPKRQFAAMKFVLYTLFGSVFLLGSMLALYFLSQQLGANPATIFSFDSLQAVIAMGGFELPLQLALFLGFFIAFAVKLPVVPLHTWLPDAHVEAPTPISMLLAGILLKMGGYGLLRFGIGWFPDAALVMAPIMGLLGVASILYAGSVAIAQTDMKKLIAYSSVSHMGFVLLALATLNVVGLNGAMFVMVSHGLVSAALFMGVGTLYRRTHSRAIADHGGVGRIMPKLFYFFMLMSMASLGLPLLSGFAGETMVFYAGAISTAFASIPLGLASLPVSIQGVTLLASLGVLFSAVYSLWLVKRLFFGDVPTLCAKLSDLTRSEVAVMGALSAMVLVLGLTPSWLVGLYQADVAPMAGALAKRLAHAGAAVSAPVLPVLTAQASPTPQVPSSATH
jgi:NAD(P)H-quinone oxidoreductase subunit 4